MKCNVESLYSLIEILKMKSETDRLLYAGLDYHGLAEVFDSVFNPGSVRQNPEIVIALFAGDLQPRSHNQRINNYDVFSRLFGIGHDTLYKSVDQLVSELKVSRESIDRRAHKFLTKFGFPYDLNVLLRTRKGLLPFLDENESHIPPFIFNYWTPHEDSIRATNSAKKAVYNRAIEKLSNL